MKNIVGALVIAYAAYLTYAVIGINKVGTDIVECQSKLQAQLQATPVNQASVTETMNVCQIYAKQARVYIPQIR
ncbi:TPA: hypothetical protein ACT5B2_000886 [Burkholderia cenocepacia]|uniref:hypothetical protein n=1 Tax=Burkholderia cepacia complex TaxID=87882 RepID=UPI0007596C05|nr:MULTISPECIES: hypothetical protein [Burkholderia cepacia complex]KVV24575.1 hypothetical protein WK78_19105 [Burkholderia cepacia]MBR8134745.1 hypothetical protein [Burkholderia cenocepacia]MCA8321006.1 hypothetical protein [Burkholderia cepacia]MDI9678477.1 hypothetical protein [Burkholderia cenocepacia]RQT79945.1 hypothetical protein DF045_01220 [Burkholderia cepacia]